MTVFGNKEIVFTIDAQGTVSDEIDLQGFDVMRINMPAAWTAADMTFQLHDGDAVWRDAYWDWGAEMVVAVAAGLSVELSVFNMLKHLRFLRIRSGTTAVPVAQNAERLITVVVGQRN